MTTEQTNDTKVEPKIIENIDEQKKDQDIQKLIELVTKQTELNGQIIKVLSDKKINKEHKQKMVHALEQGAENSKLFRDIIKDQNMNFECESIPAKDPAKNDPLNKFKNMIASFRATVDDTIAFRNPLKQDWYEVGYKAAIVLGRIEEKSQPIKNIYNSVVSFFKKSAIQYGVVLQEVRATTEKVQDKIFLIGEKRNVKQLQKKFAKTFEFLGLNSTEMSSDANFVEDISKEELYLRIQDNINKNFTASKVEGDYTFTILEGLTQNLQFEMLKNMLWPKIKSAIAENMEINHNVKLTQNDNKYMKMVQDFSKENNFNPDLVLHSLKNNPELLKGYIGTEKILENTDNIIENAAKYEKAMGNNFTYLEELMSLSKNIEDKVKLLKVISKDKEDFSEEMNNAVIFERPGITISFKQLKQNAMEAEEYKVNVQKQEDPKM